MLQRGYIVALDVLPASLAIEIAGLLLTNRVDLGPQ
jgi:hypothetical protein